MVNRFLAVGTLSECAIQFYRTHIKVRLSLEVNHQAIIMQQTISRKWNAEQYQALCKAIPYLHPQIDGIVTKGEHDRIYTMPSADQPTRLMVSGNINEWHGRIYFNAQYIRPEPRAPDSMTIELDGQWVDGHRLVNVVGDWPRAFSLDAPASYERRAYRLRLGYSAGYIERDGVVDDAPYGLQMLSCKPLDEYIDDEQMKKILLELEIMEG